jgi:hypothetical protein
VGIASALVVWAVGGCCERTPAPDQPFGPEDRAPAPEQMWISRDGLIEIAPEEILVIARSYWSFKDKGRLSPKGERLTILTSTTEVGVGEEVCIVHVHETTKPGPEIYWAGPKPVYGETINGRAVTPLSFLEYDYDGEVVPTPEVDFNYDVTKYRLPRGTHIIRWSMRPPFREHGGKLTSNELRIVVD